MKAAVRLKLDGLLRALRLKAHGLAEKAESRVGVAARDEAEDRE